MKFRQLSRRALLRGAGGISIGLPWLDIMAPRRAYAADPKRFIVVFTPNGTNNYEQFTPKGTGANFTLGTETAPLLPWKNKMLALSNVNAVSALNSEGDQHGVGMAEVLTATRWAKGPAVDDVPIWGGGISIDQRIAQDVGKSTMFPSLELGVQTTLGTEGSGVHPFSRMVYKSAATPVPAIEDPRETFKRLFSNLAPSGAGADTSGLDKARLQRKSVLDFVKEDYQQLAPRLSTKDKQKIDQHFTAISEIEKRLGGATTVTPAMGCNKPAEPSPTLDVKNPANFPQIGKLQTDLLAVALACDLTRVATLQWSWARSDVALQWIGVKDSHHDLSHGAASATLSSINKWYAEQVAYLCKTLDGFDEGGKTLLDNSVLWWTSDVSFGPTHSFTNIRALLFGSCGGYFKTGQHIDYGDASKVTNNQLMVTFMRAMGIQAAKFGEASAAQGPLPGPITA